MLCPLHAADAGSIYRRGATYPDQSTFPSPEASSVLRYTEMPLDYATGAFSMQVPLYTLDGRSLSIPLSLGYYSGGIRLDEIAGVSGLGWSLSAGGCVTRTVMDMPDEFSSPGMRHGLPSGPLLEELVDLTENTRTFSYLYDVCRHRVDAMLDRYGYSVCGLSGQFVIADDGSVCQLCGDGVLIEYVRDQSDGSVGTFTITGPDGTRYVLSEREVTTHDASDGRQPDVLTGERDIWSAPTAWYVTSASSADGLCMAEFLYRAGGDWKRTRVSHTMTRTVPSGAGGGIGSSLSTVYESCTTKQLSRILLDGFEARFSYGSPDRSRTLHTDIEDYNYPAVLRGLDVLSPSGRLLARYSFDTRTEPSDGRVILSGIDRMDSSGSRVDYWRFYYNVLGTGVSHLSQDWYGYYNGVPNLSGAGLCPYSFSPGVTSLQGVPDASRAGYLSLRRINHNGAWTSVRYEGASFTSGSQSYSIGVRVSLIAFSESEIGDFALSDEHFRRFTYSGAVPSCMPAPSLEQYMSVSAPFTSEDMSAGSGSGHDDNSATWSFTLHESPLCSGPSVRDARVYYGRVSETVSHGIRVNDPDFCRTVRYYDTSLIRRSRTSVMGRFPSPA